MPALRICGFILAAVTFLVPARTCSGAAPEWIRQFGTGDQDMGFGVSADSLGNVYTAGWTGGSLGGPNAGSLDAFLTKYDGAGAEQWTVQLGTGGGDGAFGVLADTLGNVYITGSASGDLDGVSAGSADAFLAKYDGAGALQWTKQLGTSEIDRSLGVSVDAVGNAYISGITYGDLGGPNGGSEDTFLAKYNAGGDFQWSQQLGVGGVDRNWGAVSTDTFGNVYVAGSTGGSLGGPHTGNQDAYLAKYDAAGSLMWIEQLGTPDFDSTYDVVADALGNVYITGSTGGSLSGPSAGKRDVFLAKYDAAGNFMWAEQFGTAENELSRGIAIDALDNIYITGRTTGGLSGPNAGSEDVFLAQFDAGGNLQWIDQLGTIGRDNSHGVSVGVYGDVYITGFTEGSLAGPNAGEEDVFLAKYVVPEPSALALGACSVAVLIARSRRRTG